MYVTYIICHVRTHTKGLNVVSVICSHTSMQFEYTFTFMYLIFLTCVLSANTIISV